MALSPVPRIALVPLISKQPEAWPHSGGRVLTRRGTRKKKLEIVQLWRCASCNRAFTPGPSALHNKTYPLRMIQSGAHRLRPRLHVGRDGRPSQEENQSPRLTFDDLPLAASTSSTAPIAASGAMDSSASLPSKPSDRSSSTTARSTVTRTTGRSATSSDQVRSMTIAPARRISQPWWTSWRTTCPHDLFRREDDPKVRASQAIVNVAADPRRKSYSEALIRGTVGVLAE
jgi:hypothetical protein